jgi:hypothetical protein
MGKKIEIGILIASKLPLLTVVDSLFKDMAVLGIMLILWIL